ncbi:MAG: sulfatase-like hydrolase/transferase [Nitrospiraceae bacterium]|nr:sulfatase-like hydrolase/transferase [Nitrospiraceae bacterium]
MKRRTFLGASAALLGAASLGGCGSIGGHRRLNHILVTMDTTRQDHLGLYGYGGGTSPNLDAFAEDCIVFDHCYSVTNKTYPSHAAMFTGKYPWNHAPGTKGALFQEPFDPAAKTMVNDLADAGYRTMAATSVWLLTAQTMGNGFQEFRSPHAMEMSAGEVVGRAMALLSKRRVDRAPFFLWLHLFDPHTPYAPPQEWKQKFLKKDLSETALQNLAQKMLRQPLSEQERSTAITLYDAEVAYMDSQLGVFFKFLRATRLDRHTVITVTADHGESLFENDDHHLEHHFVYEPVVRIPLMIRHPDISARRIDGVVQNIDLAPTILNWSGLNAEAMGGKDLSPLIESKAPIRDSALYVETGGRFAGATKGHWKLRRLTEKRTHPIPVPPQWIEDTRLPRIEFSPPLPPSWGHKETKGYPCCSFIVPDEVAQAIRILKFQALKEDHPQVGLIWECVKRPWCERDSTIFWGIESRRSWNQKAASFPTHLRLIGLATDKTVVAASEPVAVDLRMDDDAKAELFDLAEDPEETQNLASDKTDVFRELSQGLEPVSRSAVAHIPYEGEATEFGDEEIGAEIVEAMRAFGYL